MRAEICRYYNQELDVVYNAYLKAIHSKFNKKHTDTPCYEIQFKLKMSLNYNINGGLCSVLFMSYKTGTAVCIQYNIKQAFGANYKSHESDMTSFVEKQLNIFSEKTKISVLEFESAKESSMSSSHIVPILDFDNSTSESSSLKKGLKIGLLGGAGCLIFAIVLAVLLNSNSPSKYTCGHDSCKENGPFPCYGKNNTCPNYTYCYKDPYCDQCD